MGGFLRRKLTLCQVKQTKEENKSAVKMVFMTDTLPQTISISVFRTDVPKMIFQSVYFLDVKSFLPLFQSAEYRTMGSLAVSGRAGGSCIHKCLSQ